MHILKGIFRSLGNCDKKRNTIETKLSALQKATRPQRNIAALFIFKVLEGLLLLSWNRPKSPLSHGCDGFISKGTMLINTVNHEESLANLLAFLNELQVFHIEDLIHQDGSEEFSVEHYVGYCSKKLKDFIIKFCSGRVYYRITFRVYLCVRMFRIYITRLRLKFTFVSYTFEFSHHHKFLVRTFLIP